VSVIQGELQEVFTSVKENDLLHCLYKSGENDGISVHAPKETILKEMGAKIEQVMPAFFFT
jgi:hypothetical protein